MIFKTRPGVKKQFTTIHNFGIKNLVVSGCSFTYNNHETSAVTWPYYLRDLGGFEQVLDCSFPGAGNSHISDSLIWGLEIDQPDPAESLVVVMWSGNDRDDYICPSSNQKFYPFEFKYADHVFAGITSGTHPSNDGNTIKAFKEFSLTKTPESRAIENYLYIVKTAHYLKSQGYKFMFLNFCDPALPSRTQNLDIKQYLQNSAQTTLESLIQPITDPYRYAVKNDLLSDDDFHPSPDGHLKWTQKVLLLHLITNSIDL
jgi:hypothetical protein